MGITALTVSSNHVIFVFKSYLCVNQHRLLFIYVEDAIKHAQKGAKLPSYRIHLEYQYSGIILLGKIYVSIHIKNKKL